MYITIAGFNGRWLSTVLCRRVYVAA